MAATLRQIAEELSVSPTLVSRVLNDKPGTWASDVTRARIFQTAERLNYRPSTAARALVTGKSMLLGISAADADWHHGRFERLAEVSGFIDAASRHNFRVLVLPSTGDEARRDHFEELVRSKACDGFLLYAEQADANLYGYLGEHEMPFVVIGDPGDIDVPRVDHDNFAFMKDSVEWIAGQGRKRVAAVSPTPVPGNDPQKQFFVRRQQAGYFYAVSECGLDLDGELVSDKAWEDEAEMLAWLKSIRADALITRGLASTMQWKLALVRAGWNFPGDILLMAHLNSSELSYLEQGMLHQGLACHVHDPHSAGVKAGELLLACINGQCPTGGPVYIPSMPPRWC